MPRYRSPRRSAFNRPRVVIDFALPIESDPNERFVLRRCLLWTMRLMDRYPNFSGAMVNFLGWIMGAESHKLDALWHSVTKAHESENCLVEDLIESKHDWPSHQLAEFLQSLSDGDQRRLWSDVRSLLRQRDAMLASRVKSDLERGLTRFQQMFSLSDLEAEMCFYLLVVDGWEVPCHVFNMSLNCEAYSGRKFLAAMLDTREYALNDAADGRLAEIGIVNRGRSDIEISVRYLALLFNASSAKSMGHLYRPLGRESLSMDSFLVPEETKAHMRHLLANQPSGGMHILFYGDPGTGKSSFARTLLHDVCRGRSLKPWEVLQQKSSEERGAAIMACLHMAREGVILADEADRLLRTDMSFMERGEGLDKGWLNTMLEKPGARMIWIVNRIDGIDPAVLRRFAFSLEFPRFNRAQREDLWRGVLKRRGARRHFSDAELRAFAERYQVSAGVVDLAVRTAKDAGHRHKGCFQRAVELSLDAYMDRGECARGRSRNTRERGAVEKNYSLEGLNVSADLSSLLEQAQAFARRQGKGEAEWAMNLLFYGPPGTGKSELARHIAHSLDRPLLVKGASDIIDPYIGMTERHIAEAFREAESEAAVLVLDEVDSLLFDRGMAQRSWEISHVNEMLQGMERYRGLLICTTNRLKSLDHAVLRRFVHKVGFGWLDPAGVDLFWRRFLSPLASRELDASELRALRAMGRLSPGDFKTVRERFRLLEAKQPPSRLIQALEEEMALKNEGGKRLGFAG